MPHVPYQVRAAERATVAFAQATEQLQAAHQEQRRAYAALQSLPWWAWGRRRIARIEDAQAHDALFLALAVASTHRRRSGEALKRAKVALRGEEAA